MSKSKFDTELFRRILPALSPDEIRQLRENLEATKGALAPLTVAEIKEKDYQRFLCDGFNRHGICTDLGFPYKIEIREFDSVADVIEWMYKNQAGRRNWTQSQQAMVAEKWRRSIAEKEISVPGDTKPPAGRPQEIGSVGHAAERFGVNKADVQAAAKVMDGGSDELKKRTEAGEISVRKAATIARLPKRKQSKAIREGIDAVETDEEIQDEVGEIVPASLRDAFKSRDVFDRVMRDISTLKGTLNPLWGDPQDARKPLDGYENLAVDRQEAIRHLDNVFQALKFHRPHSLCPHPHKSGQKCPACNGLKYLTAGQYRKLPRNLRKD